MKFIFFIHLQDNQELYIKFVQFSIQILCDLGLPTRIHTTQSCNCHFMRSFYLKVGKDFFFNVTLFILKLKLSLIIWNVKNSNYKQLCFIEGVESVEDTWSLSRPNLLGSTAVLVMRHFLYHKMEILNFTRSWNVHWMSLSLYYGQLELKERWKTFRSTVNLCIHVKNAFF